MLMHRAAQQSVVCMCAMFGVNHSQSAGLPAEGEEGDDAAELEDHPERPANVHRAHDLEVDFDVLLHVKQVLPMLH